MAVVCGEGWTSVVTVEGNVFSWGRGESGQLGLGGPENHYVPAHGGGRKVMVSLAAGHTHAAGVALDGSAWTWGTGASRFRVSGFKQKRLGTEKIYGGFPVLMVACGFMHTIAMTARGVFTCGVGIDGRLGHGDLKDRRVLTQIRQFTRLAHSVACGDCHSVAIDANGGVLTWGRGMFGALGHNDEHDRHTPTLMANFVQPNTAVVVSAGFAHTVSVTAKGELWAWGNGEDGQLGLGNEENRLAPVRVGDQDVFGSPVRAAFCGSCHTLTVTKEGQLFSCGNGEKGALGHNDRNNRLVPTRVEALHSVGAKIVTGSAGETHSAVVTDNGTLYTWGASEGLGHGDGMDKLVPTRVARHLLQDACVGHCHELPPLHALAFAMGAHPRLGNSKEVQNLSVLANNSSKGCAYVGIPGELVELMVEACRFPLSQMFPEGLAKESRDSVVPMQGAQGGAKEQDSI